jgi:hypothetical protein
MGSKRLLNAGTPIATTDAANKAYYVDNLQTRQVIKVRALVLEPIDPGSILDGEFLEGHDFTSPPWKKQS